MAWNTDGCASGICLITVHGDNGDEYSDGYITTGSIPSLVFYDVSANIYYNTEISGENIGWQNQQIYHITEMTITDQIIVNP